MAEAHGYIYRRGHVSGTDLRALIDGLHGWAWTPATMNTLERIPNAVLADEGRAFGSRREVRWRRMEDGYDVLVLAVEPQDLHGFTHVLAGGSSWVIQPIPEYRLQRPVAAGDERIAATAFLAPNGAVQFVALIGRPTDAK